MTRKISRRADRTWKRLATWYGSRLFEQYGENVPEDWALVIDRVDDDRLEQALLDVRRETPIHPPTLGQFEGKIPGKSLLPNTPSKSQIICEYVMEKFGKELCKHQLAMPWAYFGPVREFVTKHAGGQVVNQPDPRGARIPACEPCGQPERTVRHPEL